MPTDNVDKAVAWDAAQASWQKGYDRAKAESADTIESLRAEVSRLSAELEGARKATIEEMAQVAEHYRENVSYGLYANLAAAELAATEIAAAIRQKGERDES